jgi:hypothetical protein
MMNDARSPLAGAPFHIENALAGIFRAHLHTAFRESFTILLFTQFLQLPMMFVFPPAITSAHKSKLALLFRFVLVAS